MGTAGVRAARRLTALLTVLTAAGCDRGRAIAPLEVDDGCPHLLANGVVLTRGDATLAWQWGLGLTGSIPVAAGDTLGNLHLTFLQPDSIAFDPAPACTASYYLRWDVADTSIADLRVVPGGFWRVDVIGRRNGTTTVTLRPRHLEHSHFITRPIPIIVGTGVADSAAASGVMIRDGESIVAGYNLDRTVPGATQGALVSEVGSTSHAFSVAFLDSAGAEFTPGPDLETVFEIGDTVIAHAACEPGDPRRFRIIGPPVWPSRVRARPDSWSAPVRS